VLEILSPTPGQPLDALPIVVEYTLTGVELEEGGLHLAVLLNGQSRPDVTGPGPILLDSADPGANTLELALLDGQDALTDPVVLAQVSFDYTGTGVGDGTRPFSTGLARIWPNPFNPSTTLELELAEARNLRLVIHDLLGRPVAELHRGPLAAGRHAFVWQDAGLPSGVYFARVEALEGAPLAGPHTVRKLVRLN
jgi:hypothetical protein